MSLVRSTSRAGLLLLSVMFLTHSLWVTAHLAFVDHCFGGEGQRHYHHHPHDHGHDHGPVAGEGPADAASTDPVAREDHHHHDPHHHPHSAEEHYRDLLVSRIKDVQTMPSCPVPPRVLDLPAPGIRSVAPLLPEVDSRVPCPSRHGSRAPPPLA